MAAEITETLLSYLAGFFDGEGCIGVTRGHGTSYYLLTVSVTNTKREVLEIYRHVFGGSIVKTKREVGHKDCYVWKVQSRKAELFLIAMHGRLMLKREQLETALQFRELFKGKHVLPRGNADQTLPEHDAKRSNVIALREDVYLKMRELNRRGVEVNDAASSGN